MNNPKCCRAAKRPAIMLAGWEVIFNLCSLPVKIISRFYLLQLRNMMAV